MSPILARCLQPHFALSLHATVAVMCGQAGGNLEKAQLGLSHSYSRAKVCHIA